MEDFVTMTKIWRTSKCYSKEKCKAKNIAIHITSKGAELILPT